MRLSVPEAEWTKKLESDTVELGAVSRARGTGAGRLNGLEGEKVSELRNTVRNTINITVNINFITIVRGASGHLQL